MLRSKVLWACVLLSLAGCQDEMGRRACSPGRTEVCACPEGAIGTQTCNADGSAWEGCRCPETGSEGEGEGVEGEHPAEGEGEGEGTEDEGGDEGEGEGPPSLVCEPGRTESCACVGLGMVGAQICNDDGSAWEECRCPALEGEGEGDEGEGEGEGPGPECLPAAELCGNDLDDDCDHETDEGFDVGVVCSVGVGQCLRSGNKICSEDRSSTVCGVVAGNPVAEICNGLDDDCDGPVDEDLTRACQNECGSDGTQTCNAGEWGLCEDIRPAVDCAPCHPPDAVFPWSVSDCNAVLVVPGLIIEDSGTEEHRQHSAAAAYLCDTSNSEEMVEQGRSAGGHAGFDLFRWFSNLFGRSLNIEADASYEDQLREIRRWQETTCRMDTEELSDEQVREYLSNLLDNRPTLDTWAECVRSVVSSFDRWIQVVRSEEPDGLELLFEREPTRDGLFTLLIHYCGTGGRVPICNAIVTIPLTVDGADCEHRDQYESDQCLWMGDARLSCRRLGGAEIQATLTVRVEGRADLYSATAYLPALCPIGEARCIGNVPIWCGEESGHWETGEPCLGEDGCEAGVCRCEPGTSIECNCDDGCPGERLCVENNGGNGERYLPCECHLDPEICDTFDNDCDGQIDEDPIDVEADVRNCGACDVRCTERVAHAEAVCEGGRCGHGACDLGFADLDDNPENGCEADCGVVNLLALPDSEHQCEGGVNAGDLSIDGDANTAYSANTGVVHPADGGHGVHLQCDFSLSEPRTIHHIIIDFSAYGRATGQNIRDHHASFAIYYRLSGDPADGWRVLEVGGASDSCSGGDGGCSVSTGGLRPLEVHLEDVVAIRAQAHGYGNASGGEGAVQGSADIYEVQAYSDQCD